MAAARKFLLVPAEAYRELLSLSEANETLAGARDYMSRLLHDKKLNASEKNALYNQQLRGYLQLRKETKEKPLKVEIAGGPKLIAGEEGLAALTDVDSEEPEEVMQTEPGLNQRPPTTPQQQQQRTPQRRRRRASIHYRAASSSSSSAAEEQQTARQSAKRVAARDRQDFLNDAVQKHFERIAKIIDADRRKFHVDEQGQILNSKGDPMRHSDYRAALLRIVRQDILGNTMNLGNPGDLTPVGTTHLRANLKKNAATKNLLSREALLDTAETLEATPSRPTGSRFQPDLWGQRSTRRF